MKVSKKEKNRQAILEVAGELFLSKGFGAVSMREIAEVCDIATGTLYNYFKSKGQIFIEIVIHKQFKLTTKFDENAKTYTELVASIKKQIISDVGTITEVEKSDWQSVFQILTSDADSSQYLSNLLYLDSQYLQSIKTYLESKAHLLPKNYSIDLLLEILYNSLGLLVIRYLYTDMPSSLLMEKGLEQIEFIMGQGGIKY